MRAVMYTYTRTDTSLDLSLNTHSRTRVPAHTLYHTNRFKNTLFLLLPLRGKLFLPHIAVGDRKQERRALSVHVPATHLVKEKELKEVRVTLEIKTDNRHTNTHARTTHLFYKHSAPTHRERERCIHCTYILQTRARPTHTFCKHTQMHSRRCTHTQQRENVEFTSLTVQKSRSGENENTRGPCIGMLPRWEQNRETKTRENCLPFGQAVREVHFGQCMRDEVGRGSGTRGIALTSKKQTSVFLDVHQSCEQNCLLILF